MPKALPTVYPQAMGWVAIAAIAFVVPFYARYILVGRRGVARWVLFVSGTLLVASVPALVPTDSLPDWAGPVCTFTAAIWALMEAIRLADFAWDRYPDETIRTQAPHFLLTFLVAPDAHWLEPTARGEARKQGLRVIGRGLAKLPFLFGLLAISTVYPTLHEYWFLQIYWALWTMYFAASAGADFLFIAPYCLAGLSVDEMFDVPPIASSPRDFWSRRWNLVFRTLAHRHIFLPLGGRDRPLLAVSAVFVFSAAVHEYLVVMALGSTQGHMAAFFLLHGAATIAYGLLSKRRGGRPFMPRPAAIGMHMVFLTVTGWLFFQPFLQVIPAHTFQLW